MEDNLNFLANGRRPQFFGNGRQLIFSSHLVEYDLIFGKIEDNLNLWQIKEDIKILEN